MSLCTPYIRISNVNAEIVIRNVRAQQKYANIQSEWYSLVFSYTMLHHDTYSHTHTHNQEHTLLHANKYNGSAPSVLTAMVLAGHGQTAHEKRLLSHTVCVSVFRHVQCVPYLRHSVHGIIALWKFHLLMPEVLILVYARTHIARCRCLD